jgi:ABC-type antimicrobial peptide transport system permease subunit
MGIPLVRGRGFTAEDRAGAAPVTVISQALAGKLAPTGDVIGRRLLFGADAATQQTFTIVGVTADFPTGQMDSGREQLLVPLAQHPGVAWNGVAIADELDLTPKVLLVARAVDGQGARALAALESLGRDLDKDFLPANIVTGRALRKNGESNFLIASMMTGGAGSVILLLAALGIYGVVGLTVAARTREIAVRAALGATRRRLLAMIVGRVVRLVLPGAIAGALLVFVLNRLNPPDSGIATGGLEPMAYVIGPAIAVLVAVLASLAPARRAASVQPMVAMRTL